MDILQHNRTAWDNYVAKKDRWTIPVSKEEIEKAKNGEWRIVLTPTKAVPHSWFPPLKGLKILGLASGGGQQGPILAALGAEVTIFDNSPKQLLQDQTVSDQFDLNIKTVQGDMRDLSVFADQSFDLIINPCSIIFVDTLQAVWQECYRVLKPKGILMTGLMNPIAFQVEEIAGKLQFVYPQPFSDLHSLPAEKLEQLKKDKEALIWGHSWTKQIGGQLAAGFALTDLYEDDWNGAEKIDAFMPSSMATRAIK